MPAIISPYLAKFLTHNKLNAAFLHEFVIIFSPFLLLKTTYVISAFNLIWSIRFGSLSSELFVLKAIPSYFLISVTRCFSLSYYNVWQVTLFKLDLMDKNNYFNFCWLGENHYLYFHWLLETAEQKKVSMPAEFFFKWCTRT